MCRSEYSIRLSEQQGLQLLWHDIDKLRTMKAHAVFLQAVSLRTDVADPRKAARQEKKIKKSKNAFNLPIVWRQIPLKKTGDTTATKTCMSWYADFHPTFLLINIISPQHVWRPELLQHIPFIYKTATTTASPNTLISLKQRQINTYQLGKEQIDHFRYLQLVTH